MDDRSYVDLPPFDGWLFVAYYTLYTSFRYIWIMMVSGMPVSSLPVAALALAAFWLWTLLKAMPGICAIMAMW